MHSLHRKIFQHFQQTATAVRMHATLLENLRFPHSAMFKVQKRQAPRDAES